MTSEVKIFGVNTKAYEMDLDDFMEILRLELRVEPKNTKL